MMLLSSRHLIGAFALLFVLAPAAWAQPATALVGGTVVNPGEAEPIEDATVLIEEGRITAVAAEGEAEVPEEARVIDASGKWIIPGLVDGHVHFFQSGGLYTRPDIIDLRAQRSYEEELARIKERLSDTFARYLRSGITSVVDVGGPMWNFEVRAMADTMARAPRVAVAGPLISSIQPSELTTDDPPILRIETPEEAREEVRRQVEEGADLVKIWYIVRQGETPEAFRPVVEATIEEAHGADTRVAVHATELETARAAVEAGADILVHSVSDEAVDDDFIRLLVENEVLYTPTIMVMERYQEVFAQQLDLTPAEHAFAQPEVVSTLFDLRALPPEELPDGVQSQMERAAPVEPDQTALDNLRRLQEAGVAIVAGTDAGNIGTPHGPALFYELQLMQQAGLTPMEVLTTATANGAELMGRSEELGTIEEGKRADLVVLGSNPLDDIANASDISRVVKEGRVFAPEELIEETPEDIVQRQVNAYNARDLEAFLDTYSDGVRVYTYPDSLLLEGKEALRERYSSLFEQAPELHAEILDRITLGTTVIDHERVTGLPGGESMEAVAVYQVREGRIESVRFIQEEEPQD